MICALYKCTSSFYASLYTPATVHGHMALHVSSTHKLHTLALFALLLQYWWVQTGGHCKPA